MNLQIRDPRAHEMARRLAAKLNISLTQAVIGALDAELKRETARSPLAGRLAVLAEELRRHAGNTGKKMNQGEVDAMWGQS